MQDCLTSKLNFFFLNIKFSFFPTLNLPIPIGHNIHSPDMLEFLIYVVMGNKAHRQCIGIPMGTDCAPVLANKYKFMKTLMKNNIRLAKKFNNILMIY